MGFFDFLGGVERQVNIFDSGKTFKNKRGNVRDTRSTVKQIGDVGFSFLKATADPFIYFGKVDIANPARELAAEFTGNKTALRNARRQSNIDLGLGEKGTDFGGGLKKLTGNTIQAGLTIAAPAISREVSSVLPNASRFVTAPITGAALGEPFNVASGLSHGGPVTKEQLLHDAVIGGLFGAGLGFGGEALASGARGVANAAQNLEPLNQVGAIGRNLSNDELLKLKSAKSVGEVKSVLKDVVPEEDINKIAPAIVHAQDTNIIRNIVTGKSVPYHTKQTIISSPVKKTTPVLEDASAAGQGTLSTSGLPKIAGADVTPPAKTTKVSLNADRLNLTPAQQKVVRKTTTETIPTMTNKEVESYAKSVGIDTKNYTHEETKHIIARQLNARQQAVSFENDLQKLRESSAPTDQIATAIEKAYSAESTARSQGTHVARQLAARRIVANELATPQQRIFQLLDNAGVDPKAVGKTFADVDFNDGNQVVSAYRKLVPPSAGEWIDLVRYNAMLSSPLTQIVNATSTAGNVAISPVERTITEALDSLRPMFGKERQYAKGEGAAYTKGLVKSFPDAIKEFKDAFSGKSVNPNVEVGTKAMIPVRAVGDNKGVDLLSFPQRLLGAFDSFHQALVRGGALEALEKRSAAGFDISHPELQAAQEGAYRAFNQQLNNKKQGYVLRGIDELTNTVMKLRASENPVVRWPAKLSLPFVRIGSNLFKQGIEYSPLGVTTIPGASEITPQLSKMIIGSTVFGIAGSLVGDNRLTWGAPTSQKEKEAFYAAGKQPYSVKIGNKWIGFAKLPPFISFNFALAAGIDDAVKNARLNSDGVQNIMDAVAKLGQFYSDQTYLKNVGDALGAIRGDSEKIAQLVSNYPQQFIPFRALSSWFARMTDDTQRKINTDATFAQKQVESLMQQVPGLRQKTTERTGPDGKPLKSQSPVVNSISPAPISTANPKKQYLTDFYDARKKAPSKDAYAKKIKAAMKADNRDEVIRLAQEYNQKYNQAFDRWRKVYGGQYGNDEELGKNFSSGLITDGSLDRWYSNLVKESQP